MRKYFPIVVIFLILTFSCATNPSSVKCNECGTILYCYSCSGTGRIVTGSYNQTCYSCSGSGRSKYSKCYSCSGTGRKDNYRCYSCSGTGRPMCYSCSGKGYTKKYNYRICNNCSGNGRITCPNCQ